MVAGLLGACGPEKNTETEGATSTESSGSTTGGTSSSTTAGATVEPTAGTDPGGASEGSGHGGGCAGDESGGVETCAALADRASCNGAPLDPAVGRCMWVAWHTTRLVDGTCSFGPPRGECQFVGCQSEGCKAQMACGTPDLAGAYRVGMDDNVSIALASWCLDPPLPALPCEFDAEGQLVEGAPECACLCDPSFPVAP